MKASKAFLVVFSSALISMSVSCRAPLPAVFSTSEPIVYSLIQKKLAKEEKAGGERAERAALARSLLKVWEQYRDDGSISHDEAADALQQAYDLLFD
jgi:hypothetical protein